MNVNTHILNQLISTTRMQHKLCIEVPSQINRQMQIERG